MWSKIRNCDHEFHRDGITFCAKLRNWWINHTTYTFARVINACLSYTVKRWPTIRYLIRVWNGITWTEQELQNLVTELLGSEVKFESLYIRDKLCSLYDMILLKCTFLYQRRISPGKYISKLGLILIDFFVCYLVVRDGITFRPWRNFLCKSIMPMGRLTF